MTDKDMRPIREVTTWDVMGERTHVFPGQASTIPVDVVTIAREPSHAGERVVVYLIAAATDDTSKPFHDRLLPDEWPEWVADIVDFEQRHHSLRRGFQW